LLLAKCGFSDKFYGICEIHGIADMVAADAARSALRSDLFALKRSA
jgi:hypothetical protein